MAIVSVYLDERLKELIASEADRLDLPMSKFIVEALAEKLRRPDLAKVPRKRIGRPRKHEQVGSTA